MKKWRRTSSSGSSSPPATCHAVISVTATDDIATWTFNANVDSIEDLSTFNLGVHEPTSIVSIVGALVILAYDSAFLTGEPYNLDPSGLTFQDALPLCPGQAGIVT